MRITVCFQFSDLLMQLYVVLGQFLQTMTYTCIFELVRRVKVQHELAFVICRSLISSLKLKNQMIWVRIGICFFLTELGSVNQVGSGFGKFASIDGFI